MKLKETRQHTVIKQYLTDLVDHYCELEDMDGDQFLKILRETIDDLMNYHQSQIDKLSQLKNKVGLDSPANLDYIDFSTSSTSLDNNSHSLYYWDTDRNL